MIIVNRAKIINCAALTLCAVSNIGYAQQWNGSADEKGILWRRGIISVGGEPSAREEKASST